MTAEHLSGEREQISGSLDGGGRSDQFHRVHIARRLAALFLVVITLLLPVGSGQAMAATDHVGQAGCPHAAMVSPSGSAGHAAMMTGMSPASHPPSGAILLPSCCFAMPTSAPLLETPLDAVDAVMRVRLRPLSDEMPAQQAIGPDLPPPRA
ncbi:hypothetical protein [Kaistia terrae]|uniref:DUF2946 domain-containing protein n=1 Tax=Kaistia terrae TaxID=537017 RepID=A0ABW0Q5J6_9HYPH|nr:hypothetical protein [Kaistia terrae]MCX5581561.1 hypothetical protein [Kaistia terrae]